MNTDRYKLVDFSNEEIEKIVLAEAKIILEKGKSNAEAYKLEVDAMGQDGFVRVRVMDQLTKLQLKLVPETLIMGGNGNEGGSMGQLISMALLEKVTGKDFLEITKKDNKVTETSNIIIENKTDQ